MAVVARMKVNSVTLFSYGATQIKMQAVVSQDDPHSEEIAAFFAATPAGNFEATIKNELAAEQFAPGEEFYVTLTKVPKS